MENKDDLIKGLADAMQKAHDECQNAPNQFIVLYKRKDNNELLGYHRNTFCKMTQDVLEAKRYSGDPLEQLQVINTNFRSLFKERESDDMFAPIRELSKSQFEGLSPDDVWLDYTYISEGMEKQSLRMYIFNPNNNES